MTLMKCDVCDSPTATSLHFGAKSCKACAAFFRRSVAQNSTFTCITGENKCKIHYEKRMNCKACRMVKCLKKNMMRHKVKSQKKHKPARQSTCSASTTDSPSPAAEQQLLPDEHIDVVNVPLCQEDEATNSAAASLMQYPQIGGMLEYQEVALDCDTESPHTSSGGEFCGDSCGIMPTFEVIEESAIEAELRQHLKCESALNRRRKISYNCTSVRDLFDDNYCIVPFEKSQLQEFDYKTFQGFHNFEYSMHYDYACSFPGYDELSSAGKNMVYRYCLGVDIVMNTAYYTSLLGYEDGVLVSSDGKTTKMVPLPITGGEPGAESYFQSNEEFQRYRNLISPKIRMWQYVIEPFCQLGVTFEEFVILKALTIWQFSLRMLDEPSRRVYDYHRNVLFACLHKICESYGEYAPERYGNLIMVMSTIFEEIIELVRTLRMSTFFDIIGYGDVLKIILDPHSIF